MKQCTVRVPARAYELIEHEAKKDGISTAHFMRDAALAVVWYRAGVSSSDAALAAALEQVGKHVSPDTR